MACIHVLVGQCGNQLGTTILDTIASAAVSVNYNNDGNNDGGKNYKSDSDEYQQYYYQSQISHTYFKENNFGSSSCGSNNNKGLKFSIDSSVEYIEDKRIPPIARVVLVDMESKVVNSQYRKRALRDIKNNNNDSSNCNIKDSSDRMGGIYYSVLPSQCVVKEEGAANNWAFGYHLQGASVLESVLECVRKEFEAVEFGLSSNSSGGSYIDQDNVKNVIKGNRCFSNGINISRNGISAIHVVHSLAGGTGSGVGCLISQALRDELCPRSSAALLHTVVAPFTGGEVATQAYNSVLAYASLDETADAVVVLSNDEAVNVIDASRSAFQTSRRVNPIGRNNPGRSNKAGSVRGSVKRPFSKVTKGAKRGDGKEDIGGEDEHDEVDENEDINSDTEDYYSSISGVAINNAENAVSFEDINCYMADIMSSLLLPSMLTQPPEPQVKTNKIVANSDRIVDNNDNNSCSPFRAKSGQTRQQLERQRQMCVQQQQVIYPSECGITELISSVAIDPSRKFVSAKLFPTIDARRVSSSAISNRDNLSLKLTNKIFNNINCSNTWSSVVAEACRYVYNEAFYFNKDVLSNCFNNTIKNNEIINMMDYRYMLCMRGPGAIMRFPSPFSYLTNDSNSNFNINSYKDIVNTTGYEALAHSLATFSPSLKSRTNLSTMMLPNALLMSNQPCFVNFNTFTNNGSPNGNMSFNSPSYSSPYVSLFHTSACIGKRIALAAEKTENMLYNEAYVHHYLKYGLERDDFDNALLSCWKIAKSYGYDVDNKEYNDVNSQDFE